MRSKRDCDWSEKITPLSNLTWASLLVEWKLTAKAELNCEIYKWRKCSKKTQFLSSEQPCKLKSLDVALNIAGVEKIRSENLRLRSTLEVVQFEFWIIEALATVQIFVFCGWRFSNQFDIVSETRLSCNSVGRELWLAIAAVPRSGLEHS